MYNPRPKFFIQKMSSIFLLVEDEFFRKSKRRCFAMKFDWYRLMTNSFMSNKNVYLIVRTQTQEWRIQASFGKTDDGQIFMKFDYFEVKFPFLRDNALGSMLSLIKGMCHYPEDVWNVWKSVLNINRRKMKDEIYTYFYKKMSSCHPISDHREKKDNL